MQKPNRLRFVFFVLLKDLIHLVEQAGQGFRDFLQGTAFESAFTVDDVGALIDQFDDPLCEFRENGR
jgi:hypothetical protein